MGKLFEQTTSFENLHKATWAVFKGKRKRFGANQIFFNLEKEIFKLRQQLKEQSYKPGVYRSFWIYEPKPRYISASSLKDRIVHHAVVQVIAPLFEKRFIYHSYACREGKGNHKALKQFVAWSRKTKYCLMLDIQKFFASIDHEILKQDIRRVISDKSLLRLIDCIIDHSNDQEVVRSYFPGDDLFTPQDRRKGIPIGNLTSQFLANVFLDRIDHFIKDKCRLRYYLRYVDDLAICHNDKSYLSDLKAIIKAELLDMRLILNRGKSRVRRLSEGISFLGFVVRPSSVRLASSTIQRGRLRVHRLKHKFAMGHVSLNEVKQALLASGAHAAHGDSYYLRTKLFHGPFVRVCRSV